ncbi:hypothetical protein QWY28_13325 [Nocardioides sp. SOB77]|uniref:Uncharacterized protein n=1 Tax=Nocardioides oceani TaxID=3058369 RepID=A0ABT8FHB2_9ACTN|nr:hypothetical protein [Nocardioides oceani]MDN4173936.1 hypothetical protein [Nocardioides oceani]
MGARAVTAPSSYVDRVRALVGRGLSTELGADLLQAGNVDALTHLEAAADADLAVLSSLDHGRRAVAAAAGITAAELTASLRRAAVAGWSVAEMSGLAGLPEAEVERACNGPRLWQDEGDQA